MITLTKRSILSGKDNTMELPITWEAYNLWELSSYGLVQDAFPELTEDQREFMLSGATKEEWDAEFARDDDTDEFFDDEDEGVI